ncbi:MAG: permease [Candidatus Zipacnadales bacterium]
MPGDVTLNDIVDVFSCCILNWEAVTVMLPAFVLAGAIAVFVPPAILLKYFGPAAKKPVAYGVAAVSGCVLSVCSCNIVPLFISIYRRGAGIGPAITFLYAGPAINIVSLVFVYQVIGWRMGLWRMIAVPVIAILAGLIMSFLFWREENERQTTVESASLGLAPRHSRTQLLTLLGLLLAIMVVGSWKQTEMRFMTWPVKIIAMGSLAALAGFMSARWFNCEELKEWGFETWKLIRLVVPILLISVLVIGYLASVVKLPMLQKLGLTSRGGNSTQSAFLVAAFGSLMYFPILSEIAFTKAFLKLNDLPAHLGLILLLTGPGLSLPGMILVGRAAGVRKVMTYVAILIVLTATIGIVFQQYIGRYVCPCTTGKPDPFPLWDLLGRSF